MDQNITQINTNITNIGVDKKYPVEQELKDEIESLIYALAGQISVVSAVGILEMIKFDLINKTIPE